MTFYRNECDVITLLNMIAECSITNQPTSQNSYDGSITLTISGGTSPYLVSWSNGVIQSVTSASTITNLNVGSYIATITDYFGDYSSTTICTLTPQTTTTTSTTTTTTEKPYSSEFCMTLSYNQTTLKINFIYNGLVNGQHSWISNAPVGYTITGDTTGTQWKVDGFPIPSYGITNTEPPSSIWTPLGFGKSATMTTSNGSCTIPTITLSESIVFSNTPFNLQLNKNEPICGCDGAITILATNGTPPYNYSIDNGVTYKNSPIFNNLCNGLYSVSVADNDGNVSNSSITLTRPPLPTQYTLSLNKNTRTILNNGATTTKVTDITFSVTPKLPDGASITFDLIHNNTFKCSPIFSAASLTTNTIFTKNTLPISLTLSGVSTGTTVNTYPGCQDQNIFVSTYTENWAGLEINSTDDFILSTTSSVSQNVNMACYYVDDLDTYYLLNLKINNCSCCSVRNI